MPDCHVSALVLERMRSREVHVFAAAETIAVLADLCEADAQLRYKLPRVFVRSGAQGATVDALVELLPGNTA